MNLGFKEKFEEDNVHFKQYGYRYSIVTKKLTKRIHLDWDKPTQECTLIRCDKHENIKKKIKVQGLNHLKQIIHFYTD